MTVHFHDISEQVDHSTAGGARIEERSGIYRSGIKRALDLTIVILSLPIALPIILFFAGLVALDGHNPFYRQDRVGRNGRVFRIWKLRSMVPDAEARLAAFLSTNKDARRGVGSELASRLGFSGRGPADVATAKSLFEDLLQEDPADGFRQYATFTEADVAGR